MTNITTLIKTCSRCNKKLPCTLKYFCGDKRAKDKLCSECKVCHNEQMKQHYQKHQKRLLNKSKQYYKTLNGYLHKVFNDMTRRCNNPNFMYYKNYGGRGIKCLFGSADEFINYVVNELKIDPRRLTIDRINNDENYECGNIQFITQAENNRRKPK